jgi:hypothetical protein
MVSDKDHRFIARKLRSANNPVARTCEKPDVPHDAEVHPIEHPFVGALSEQRGTYMKWMK